jgi:Fibronectin type III domain
MGKHIVAQLGFSRMSNDDLAVRAAALVMGTTNNKIDFPDPPIDLATFDQAVKNLRSANVDVLDGGKMAFATQASAREVVISYYRIIAAYVVLKSAGDEAIFTASGLIAVTPKPAKSKVLPPPVFRKVFHGFKSGQISFYVKALDGAYSYVVEYAVDGPELGPWTEIRVANVKSATTVSGLTPGTRYVFRVRALGAIDYTNWSDSVTLMCI